MTGILRFSEAANLALHACAVLASRNEDAPVPHDRIAECLGVSPSHLGKVMQRLVRAGILESVRGASGGFSLAGDPAGLTLLRILESVDGPVNRTGCLLGRPSCVGGRCALAALGEKVSNMVSDSLGKMTLKAFVARQLPRKNGRKGV
jgi:Rrf2 family protein